MVRFYHPVIGYWILDIGYWLLNYKPAGRISRRFIMVYKMIQDLTLRDEVIHQLDEICTILLNEILDHTNSLGEPKCLDSFELP